jgi:membrane protein DedA with SNARE-associated domain
VNVNHLLEAVPPLAIYLLVAGFILIESLGIPFPGEIVLISAALLASQHTIGLNPVWVAVAAAAGAIPGNSIGYFIGRRWGRPLFDWLGRKVPRHFGPAHVAYAERIFDRWGVLAVFVGRFIALLRIFAGPLSGALEMPYPRFLVANVAGGICWAGGLTAAIYYLGEVANTWFSRFSYIGLGVALVVGLVFGWVIKRRTTKAAEAYHAELQEKAAAEQTR